MTIEDIFKKHYRELITYALAIVNSEVVAEDIVSDIFEKCLLNRQYYESKLIIYPLLLVMVRNRCIDHLKKQKVIAKSVKDVYDLYFSEVKDEDNADLYEVRLELIKLLILQLNKRNQLIFKSIFVDKLKVTEIMDLYDIKRENYRSTKRYIINKIKKLLNPYKNIISICTIESYMMNKDCNHSLIGYLNCFPTNSII